MTIKDKLYLTGSVVCFAATGAIFFYLVKENIEAKSNNVAAEKSNLSLTAAGQTSVALVNSPSVSTNVTAPQDSKASGSSADNNSPTVAGASSSAGDGSGLSSGSDSGQHGHMINIPAGSKPFFGQIASIDGLKLVISSSMKNHNNADSAGTSGGTSSTVTVVLNSNTTFGGGTKDNLASGVRIFGYGTANSDGSITAANIQINPSRPAGSGFSHDGTDSGQ